MSYRDIVLSSGKGWRAFVVAAVLGASLPTVAATTLLGDAKAENGQSFAFAAGQCAHGLFVEWRDEAGRVAAREEVSLSGESWSQYRLERPNVGQVIEGVRVGDRLRLITHRQGERKEQEISVTDEVVAGPLLIRRLQAALSQLRQGEPLELDYLIADQGATLRLKVQRVESNPGPGTGMGPGTGAGRATRAAGSVRLRMEAASPWMRPFVPQTFLTFDARGELVAMQGRFLPLAGTASRSQPLAGVLSLRPATFDGAVDGALNSGRQSLVAMQSSCNMTDLS